MGHTNSTTYYNLPQFLTSDKPAWLTDINNAMSDIDTAIHSAQSDASTAGTNASQALLDASAASTAAAAADAKGAGACASIEAAFDSTAVYAIGAKVMYNSLLYRCTVAVTTPGPWTGSANWERITVNSIIPADAAALPLGSSTPVGSTAAAVKGIDISANISLNSTLFELETWGYINAYDHGDYIIVDFAGVKAKVAIAENWNTVFSIPKTASKASRLIVYEQLSGANDKNYSEVRIQNATTAVEVYSCAASYWLAGQMYIRTA